MRRRISMLLAVCCLCLSTLVIGPPEASAQCATCHAPAAVRGPEPCGIRPVRRYFRWLRARRQANFERICSGRLPRVFPLLWR